MNDDLISEIKKINFSITIKLYEKMKEHNMFGDNFDMLMAKLIIKEIEQREFNAK